MNSHKESSHLARNALRYKMRVGTLCDKVNRFVNRFQNSAWYDMGNISCIELVEDVSYLFSYVLHIFVNTRSYYHKTLLYENYRSALKDGIIIATNE